MEDDYCINPFNLHFDIEMVNIYKSQFKSNIGWLAFTHCNGIISKQSLEVIGDDILNKFYNLSNMCKRAKNSNGFTRHPQVIYSLLLTNHSIQIINIDNYYICSFWESRYKHIRLDTNLSKDSTTGLYIKNNNLSSLYNIIAVQFIPYITIENVLI
jgi:hypothetical protein